ncbi:MAG: cytochrome C oxidase subunit IV family protein [Deltaproteobacteria bacterium]|nr:cytochrome C oxidase subunit IV family protein [Deltaproteobacteria bacterium]MBW2394968.1 cytochrome C oxidase subunit IV family protein [Deltaproteobacteria bacterium]
MPEATERRSEWVLLATGCLLLALTAWSYWIAETGTTTAWFVLGIAVLKAHFIAGIFMELHAAPRVWAVSLSVFLFTLASVLIALFS